VEGGAPGGGAEAGGAPAGGGTVPSGGAPGSGGSGGTPSGGAAGPTEVACSVTARGEVTFSPPSGTFEEVVMVTLSGSQPTDELRYTTDHSPPTSASPLYSGPLSFRESTDLRVQVFVAGAAVGAPSGAVYVARSGDAQHDLPVLVLDSFGTTPSSDVNERDYVDVALLGLEPVQGATSLAAQPSLATQAAFHVRGQSSSRYAKKPYRLELREATGADRDCPMLGMPSESDWVLHSPFADKSLIRNAFVYSLGKDMGLAAPRFRWVELYLSSDGEALDSQDYQGVYLLVENIKNQKSRLNLEQLKPADTALPALTGGYIFKFDWSVRVLEQPLPCPSGQSNCWSFIEVVDPKPWVPEQQQYLTEYLQQLTDALHFSPPSDPTGGYPAFLDVASFVDTVIMNELTRNLDAYVRSQFLHKDRDGKVVAGPLWDFDLIAGVGMSSPTASLATSGFQYEASKSRLDATADWFPTLIADPVFGAALRTRYQQLRQGLLSDAQVSARITTLSLGLSAGAARNFEKWDNLSAERIDSFTTPTASTWDGQLAAMRAWLVDRLAWLDTQWG
jgi:CotH kinase protein/Chitobiase/beta-hexosaminidase C-terminal domain